MMAAMTDDHNTVEADTCTHDAPVDAVSDGCSLPAGHDGQHIAICAAGQIVAAWH